jgi:hypothetical protein
VNKPKPHLPDGQAEIFFCPRIWHWRAKKYIYASDYGLKSFPIRRRR